MYSPVLSWLTVGKVSEPFSSTMCESDWGYIGFLQLKMNCSANGLFEQESNPLLNQSFNHPIDQSINLPLINSFIRSIKYEIRFISQQNTLSHFIHTGYDTRQRLVWAVRGSHTAVWCCLQSGRWNLWPEAPQSQVPILQEITEWLKWIKIR